MALLLWNWLELKMQPRSDLSREWDRMWQELSIQCGDEGSGLQTRGDTFPELVVQVLGFKGFQGLGIGCCREKKKLGDPRKDLESILASFWCRV